MLPMQGVQNVLRRNLYVGPIDWGGDWVKSDYICLPLTFEVHELTAG